MRVLRHAAAHAVSKMAVASGCSCSLRQGDDADCLYHGASITNAELRAATTPGANGQRWRFLGELPRTFTIRAMEGDRYLWVFECERCQSAQVFDCRVDVNLALPAIPCRHCALEARVAVLENRPDEGEQAGQSGKSGPGNAAPASLAGRALEAR